MAGRKRGKVQRDSVVTSALDDLVEEIRRDDPEFRAAIADRETRLKLLREFARVRRRMRMSQTQVARQMQTTQSAVSEMEQGLVEPRLSTLQRYARILGHCLKMLLVAEPVVPYTDRTIHYPSALPVAIDAPTEQQLDVDDDPYSRSANRAVRVQGNVVFVEFERRADSGLTHSLAERLTHAALA